MCAAAILVMLLDRAGEPLKLPVTASKGKQQTHAISPPTSQLNCLYTPQLSLSQSLASGACECRWLCASHWAALSLWSDSTRLRCCRSALLMSSSSCALRQHLLLMSQLAAVQRHTRVQLVQIRGSEHAALNAQLQLQPHEWEALLPADAEIASVQLQHGSALQSLQVLQLQQHALISDKRAEEGKELTEAVQCQTQYAECCWVVCMSLS